MAEIILPLPTSSTPKLYYKVILDGSEFRFYFQWMLREDSGWHISLYDKEDTLILSGRKLVPWFDILSALPKTNLPLGQLGLVCLSQTNPKAPDITLENLSTDFALVYYSVT